MKLIQPDIEYIITPSADEAIDRDEIIETQRERIAALESQLDALRSHQAQVRANTQHNYAEAIVRMLRYKRAWKAARREAAKWCGIATGQIQEVGK